jgi:hypothetical protein
VVQAVGRGLIAGVRTAGSGSVISGSAAWKTSGTTFRQAITGRTRIARLYSLSFTASITAGGAGVGVAGFGSRSQSQSRRAR